MCQALGYIAMLGLQAAGYARLGILTFRYGYQYGKITLAIFTVQYTKDEIHKIEQIGEDEHA